MIINFSNLGGGGGSYTLPTATSQTLGGVKIGSGVTVTSDGTISVEGSDSSVLKSVAELPSDAELGDVVSLASSGESYPDGITYERRTYTDGDGVRFTFPNGSLTGHTSDNPVFLGTVKANNYPGSAYEMYAYNFEGVYEFVLTLDEDFDDPYCVIYMNYDDQGSYPFEGVVYDFIMDGQDRIVDVYPDSSMMVPSLVFEGLPEGGSLGVFQYDGDNWNQIGAGGSGSTSDYIPEITVLPETPVDGAIYNYNGTLIKYVDGAGNWGEWLGHSGSNKTIEATPGNGTSFTYAGVIPSSMDGQQMCRSTYFSSNIINWYFDLQNNRIVGKVNNVDTYYVEKNGSPITATTSSYKQRVTWDNNKISFVCIYNSIGYGAVYPLMDQYCSVETNNAHYELVQPASAAFDYNLSSGYSSTVFVTDDGRIRALGVPMISSSTRINNSYCAYVAVPNQTGLPYMSVPTTTGDTGTLCVSSGGWNAPVWRTVAQALGVSFWTGTQDEYDALGSYSPTTLYIIIPDA